MSLYHAKDAAESQRVDTRPSPHALAKELLSRSLIDLRTVAGFTQTQLARRLGWTTAVASRIESAQGPLPDLTRVARYARACDLQAILVFASLSTSSGLRVHSALMLQVTRHAGYYQRFDCEVLFEFARALRAARKAVGVSQLELTARGSLDAPVCPAGSRNFPLCSPAHLATLIRYASGCRVNAGLVFARSDAAVAAYGARAEVGTDPADSSGPLTIPDVPEPEATPLPVAATEIASSGGSTWVVARAATFHSASDAESLAALTGRLILTSPNITAPSVRIGSRRDPHPRFGWGCSSAPTDAFPDRAVQKIDPSGRTFPAQFCR